MRLMPMIAAALAVGLGSFGLAPEAEAKQCVWNKGAYVLRVDWFNPKTVTPTKSSDPAPLGGTYIDYTFTEQPVQTDMITTASGRCIDRGPTQYDAVLSLCGGYSNARVIEYPSNWPVDSRIDCSIWGKFTPSTKRYLDTWGGILHPASGDGGPI